MSGTTRALKPRKLVSWGPRERRLLERARGGDREAGEELYRSMMPLARRMAWKYHRSDEQLEDLVQVANLALFKALRRFDVSRGVDFPAFAVPTIAGELKRYYRDHGWAVHVPRRAKECALKVERELARMPGQLGRSPTPAELADRCQISVKEVLDAHCAMGARSSVPLDARPADDALPGPSAEEPGFRNVEEGDVVWPTLGVLPEREQRILKLRFIEELTQQEIASREGLSQMHVSRLLRHALSRIAPVLAAQI